MVYLINKAVPLHSIHALKRRRDNADPEVGLS